MGSRRLGVIWERESRLFLKERFNTEDIFKLINPERIDWIVFYKKEDITKIALVESKFTKKEKYYPFENSKKRGQIKEYFKKRDNLREKGLSCDIFFLIKRGKDKKVFFEKIEDSSDIKTSY
jgi:hypothetical protein